MDTNGTSGALAGQPQSLGGGSGRIGNQGIGQLAGTQGAVGFVAAVGKSFAGYREALDGGHELAEVLRRNDYGGRPPADAAPVLRLEAYVRVEAGRLAAIARSDLIK